MRPPSFTVMPMAMAPLKQQSRITSCRFNGLAFMESCRVRARRAVAGEIEQQQIIGRPVGKQRLHRRRCGPP